MNSDKTLDQSTKQLLGLLVSSAVDVLLRKQRREILNNAFRTLFQACWQLRSVRELNAIYIHVLLSHWESLFLSRREISRRLDHIIWLVDMCKLRHVWMLANCAQSVMQRENLPAFMSHAHAWLLCTRAFDASWLMHEPKALSNIVVHHLRTLDQEKSIGQA